MASKGGGKGKRGGRASEAGGAGAADWDAAQSSGAPAEPLDLRRQRPQRPVEVFPGLSVAADWPERRAPRSGSAFYLPLIWTALVLTDLEAGPGGAPPSAARRQFETLGDAKHFGKARRSTLEDLRSAQLYWQQVFSGWRGWAARMRAAIDAFPGGCDGLVARHVQQLSVSACAAVYGDLSSLGGLPHISNAKRSPDQDAILDLDLMLRMEVEACVQTLILPGGEAHAEAGSAVPASVQSSSASGGAARDAPGAGSAGDGPSEAAKEIMKVKKKLREIGKLREKTAAGALDTLQQKKVDGEAELLAQLAALGGEM